MAAAAGTAYAAGNSLKVVEIGRSGRTVNGPITVVDSTGMPSFLQSGRALSLARGTYTVLADVIDGATQTLVARKVRVSGKATLVLDARKGRQVGVSLDVPGKAQLDVRVCAPGGGWTGAEAGGQAGSVYVVPSTDRSFSLGYLAAWNADSFAPGPAYVLSGVRAGIPAGTLGRFSRSGLAKWRIDARAGENTTTYSWVALQPTPRQPDCRTDLISQVAQGDGGYIRTAYVSPGVWTARNDFEGPGGTFASPKSVAAKRSYWTIFNRAVRGPASIEVPSVFTSHRLIFSADRMLADQYATTDYGSTMTIGTFTLRKAGKVIVSKRLTQWGNGPSGLDVVLKSKGWYSLTADASAYAPGSKLSAGMLSTRSTLSYHFYADPNRNQVAKAFATRFLPSGLDLANQAKAGSTTTLTVQAVRGTSNATDISVPKATVKSIRLWASYDNGRTWHAVGLKAAASGRWTAQVRNPASGAVTLRTKVISASGDSATETVYRAWSVR